MPVMDRTGASHADAFAGLARALRRRRAAQAGLRARAVLVALALLVAGFAYWQVRVPLDGALRAQGVAGASAHLAVVLASCAALAFALAYERHRALLERPPGPEWLALPVPPTAVLQHLRGESRRIAALAMVPAIAALAAGAGLLPLWVLTLAAAAFIGVWLETTRAACAIAQRLAARRADSARALDAAARLLVPRAIAAARAACAPASWRSASPASALAALDRRASGRAGPSRTRLRAAAALALLMLLAWGSGAPPLLARAQSFAAFMLVSAALGAWAIARAADMPASFQRPLPIAPAHTWRARALPLAAAVALLAFAAAAAAALRGGGGAVGVALLWPIAGLAVALLGLHHGLTLPSHRATAENLYAGWLAVMLAASWMIPLMGWGVLAGALAHSLRRLPRGAHPEAL